MTYVLDTLTRPVAERKLVKLACVLPLLGAAMRVVSLDGRSVGDGGRSQIQKFAKFSARGEHVYGARD